MYYKQNKKPLPLYEIHPTSLKLITKGHPWITLDDYSEKFHPKEKFIVAQNRGRPVALFIHDPVHKKVRARLWSKQGSFDKQIKNFKQDLSNRLKTAINKRAKLNLLEQRDHFYLVFGEGDNIPGLFVNYLNGQILIQTYTDYWKKHQEYIIQQLTQHINAAFDLDIDFTHFWVQARNDLKAPAKCLDHNINYKIVEVKENGIQFKVILGKYYDNGIYTDMAAIRKKLAPVFKHKKNVLNLYSYTGAFSLFAMNANNEAKVTSVDLSEPYLSWCEENIALNADLDKENHISINDSVSEFLDQALEGQKKYDLIISDPPSSSSDGNSVSNSFQTYGTLLPQIEKVLSDDGNIIVLLNTHKTSFKKFEDKIKKTIYSKKLSLFVSKRFFLHEDCPTSKNFPEGSYLKGILLKRKDKIEETKTEEKEVIEN